MAGSTDYLTRLELSRTSAGWLLFSHPDSSHHNRDLWLCDGRHTGIWGELPWNCVEYPYLDTLAQYPRDFLWMPLASCSYWLTWR